MKTREFPRGMTFIAVLAALLLAFPGVGLAGEGEKADQEYEPPTEEEQQEQEEAWPQEQEQEEERQTERERRQEEAREERTEQQMERQTPTQTGQTAQVTLSVRTASADELTNQPQQYFGELVQVSAQVEKKHGKHMLTLQPAQAGTQEQAGVRTDVPGRTATTQGDNLLVIIPREASADIPENETLEIVGQVRPLLWTEFERDFAWFDMDMFQEFQSEVDQAETVRTDQPEMREETRPVLIATSIKSEDGQELLKQEGSESPRSGRTGGDAR